LDKNYDIIIELNENLNEVKSSTNKMVNFFLKSKQICCDVDIIINNVKDKYRSVLDYFGEDSAMASIDFFSTLAKFVNHFVITCNVVKRNVEIENKKELKNNSNNNTDNTQSKARRRASALI
jgi:hypothetical protein